MELEWLNFLDCSLNRMKMKCVGTLKRGLNLWLIFNFQLFPLKSYKNAFFSFSVLKNHIFDLNYSEKNGRTIRKFHYKS